MRNVRFPGFGESAILQLSALSLRSPTARYMLAPMGEESAYAPPSPDCPRLGGRDTVARYYASEFRA